MSVFRLLMESAYITVVDDLNNTMMQCLWEAGLSLVSLIRTGLVVSGSTRRAR